MTNPFEAIDSRLSNIENLLLEIKHSPVQVNETSKPQVKIFRVKTAAEFLGIAESTLYVLTSKKEVPFYKKNGRIYFMEADLIDYLKQARIKTKDEIDQEINKKRG